MRSGLRGRGGLGLGGLGLFEPHPAERDRLQRRKKNFSHRGTEDHGDKKNTDMKFTAADKLKSEKRARAWAERTSASLKSETMIAPLERANQRMSKRARRLHRGARPLSVRKFAGAESSDLLADFTGRESSLNADIYQGWRRLFYRAKELAENNPYAKQFLQIMANNVVGPNGFKLQMQIKNSDDTPDDYANKIIERGWAEFGDPEFFTTSGRLSRQIFETQAMQGLARDGEVIVRKVKGFPENPHRFSVMLMDPALLDNEYMENLPNGNFVRMGVEFNGWRRPVAYHFRTCHPGDVYHAPGRRMERERIPASEIIHAFMPQAPDQWRGVTWFHAAIKQLHHMAAFQEAAIVAARVGASKMGFLTSDATEYEEDEGEEVDASGNRISETEAGLIEELAPGQSFTGWDPQFPSTDPSAFTKSMLKGVSAALGVSYPSLARDLEGVNYSSIRSGVLEDRDYFRLLQHFFIQQIERPIFKDWLEMFLLTPAAGSLPAAKLSKFCKPKFVGRTWDWVDPMKDTQAEVLQLKNGLKTWSQIAAEKGQDFADIVEQRAKDEKLMKDNGISLEGYGEEESHPAEAGQAAKTQRPGEDEE